MVLFQLARFEYVRQAKEWNIYEEDLVSQAEEIINAWEKGMEDEHFFELQRVFCFIKAYFYQGSAFGRCNHWETFS